MQSQFLVRKVEYEDLYDSRHLVETLDRKHQLLVLKFVHPDDDELQIAMFKLEKNEKWTWKRVHN